jgi:predicted DNA-binding antitoxin AbrB/MazE fold protein
MQEVHVTEAIFANGVLTPRDRLSLKENERVRVIVQTLNGEGKEQREAALGKLTARAQRLQSRSSGPYPTRDELHDRP